MRDLPRRLDRVGVLVALSLFAACAPAARDDGAARLPIDVEGSLQNPCFSPDGASIVFTRWGRYNEPPAALFVHSLSSGATRALVDDGNVNVNLPGACFLDGSRVVFSSDRTGHDEIFVVDMDAPADVVQLTARPDLVAFEPTASPDGDRFAFESHEDDDASPGVLAFADVGDAPADEAAITLVLPAVDDRQPSWSSDGRVLFQRRTPPGDEEGRWDLWTIGENGADLARITETSDVDETDASWSTDATRIVYSSDDDGAAIASIFVATDGEVLRATRSATYDGAPAFSPDGARIAFESSDDDPDGSDGTSLWLIDAPR